ncbi:MAG: hypothetical protein JWQ97_2000 [Phenylobacterium sp.]|nr:hypothetical protein [Phenylobacterium sp.]
MTISLGRSGAIGGKLDGDYGPLRIEVGFGMRVKAMALVLLLGLATADCSRKRSLYLDPGRESGNAAAEPAAARRSSAPPAGAASRPATPAPTPAHQPG